MNHSKISKPAFLLILFATIVFASCRVSFVPGHDATMVTRVEQAAAATDNLYDDMIGSTEKDYNTYAAGYDSVNQQISEILFLDSARKNPKVVLIIANDIAARLKKYQSEHKLAGSINNAQARTYKDYMHALFETLHNSEINFK